MDWFEIKHNFFSFFLASNSSKTTVQLFEKDCSFGVNDSLVFEKGLETIVTEVKKKNKDLLRIIIKT